MLLISKSNSNLLYKIETYISYNKIEVLGHGKTILTFFDYKNDGNNLNTFTRKINNHEYIFVNGELIIKKLIRKTSFLKPIKINKQLINKFLTMDIETRIINNKKVPYCICIFDGIKSFSYYLNDYNDHIEMMNIAINSILIRKYNKYKIYLHNLSNFDGIFLFKILTSLKNFHINHTKKDGKMIDIELISLTYNFKINFRDSLLMLPISLKNLAKSFQIDNKGLFPYLFVNESTTKLDYEGLTPELKYFINVSEDKYNNYSIEFKNKTWNLKNETIKYCNLDCKILYQIIEKFNYYIFDLFNLNIHNYPTLPSLAFAIYRSKYLKDFKIPLITGQIFNDIRKSYTGGSTDMYIPHGKNIYAYDVNSLYPYVMKECPVPIGNITYFEGDISKIDNNPYGFFEVEITAPNNLNIPILQTKINTGHGTRTISPLGT